MGGRLSPSVLWPELVQLTLADKPRPSWQGSSLTVAPRITQARQKSRWPSHAPAATHT